MSVVNYLARECPGVEALSSPPTIIASDTRGGREEAR
jgi:hypothetical protein